MFKTTETNYKKVQTLAVHLTAKLGRIVKPAEIYRTLFENYLEETAEEIEKGRIKTAVLYDREKERQNKIISITQEEWESADELCIQLTIKLNRITRISQLLRACFENYLRDAANDIEHSTKK